MFTKKAILRAVENDSFVLRDSYSGSDINIYQYKNQNTTLGIEKSRLSLFIFSKIPVKPKLLP